ncbi:MAG: hypothetical protein AAFV53_16250 [Myxococcota bacterium]
MLFFILFGAQAMADEWHISGGGEFNARAIGVMNAGYRTERWSVQLFTDTVEVRTDRELDRGRFWVAGRLEAIAAGLLNSPWMDGAPALEQAVNAGYAGVEGGWQRYLPWGFYVGVQGFARYYFFFEAPTTTVSVPAPRERLQGEVVLGWWTEQVQASLTAGGQISQGPQPHIRGQLSGRMPWTVSPTGSLLMGWGSDQDFLTRTRLGGLNPYVVPLAGAGWAEFLVEDYAAIRLGPSVQTDWLHMDLVADLAWFDDQSAAGVGVLSRFQPTERRGFVEINLGYAPWLARQPNIGRGSLWLLAGLDWGR